jgi:hypothetical protein
MPPDGGFGLARDHHLGGLDNRHCIIATPELQLADGVGGDDGGKRLIADSQTDLSEQAVDPHFIDEAPEAIAAAQRHDQSGRAISPVGMKVARWGLPGEQSLDFRVRQAVMSAVGFCGANLSLMDPLLQSGVADAHAIGGGSYGEKRHFDSTSGNRLESYRGEDLQRVICGL